MNVNSFPEKSWNVRGGYIYENVKNCVGVFYACVWERILVIQLNNSFNKLFGLK